jgi:hypothetical protein
MHKCINNSIGNVYHLEQLVGDFFPYSQQKLQFDKPVTIIFQSDEDNSHRMLGKTAYYDPSAMEVVLYVDGRHPKDIMRSLSHELVHHAQNCRGDFTTDSATPEGYAQSDPHLRKMEREAYTKGNLIFRDYEDLIKTDKKQVNIDFTNSGEPKMSLKEWKNAELNRNLMKKWGLLKEEKLPEMDESMVDIGSKEHDDEEGNRPSMAKDMDLDEGHECGPGCGCPGMEEGMKYRDEDDLDENYIDLAKRRGQYHKAITADDLSGLDKESEKDPADYTGTREREKRAVQALKKGKALEEDSEGEETYHYGEDEGRDDRELHDLIKRHATRSHIDALKRDMDYDEDHEDRHERGTHFREGKITVKEAKQITRRIIERIKREGK